MRDPHDDPHHLRFEETMSETAVQRCSMALALMVVIVTGCDSGNGPSSRSVSELWLTVNTSETEPDRRLMVVGENASARVETRTEEGCLIESPCTVSVDVEVRSSAPNVVSPQPQRVRTPGSVELVAHAPGTATLSVTVDGLTEEQRIDVVSAPLPLDAIQVLLGATWNDLPSQYDPSGSLISVEVPTGEVGALRFVALRGGKNVLGIPFGISSSAAGIALVTTGCPPPSVDPQCTVRYDGWVMGVSPGDALITVSARNLSTGFTARIVEAPAAAIVRSGGTPGSE
jgi:hypothetical protein